MLGKLIEWSIHNIFIVILLTLFTVVAGIYSLQNTPIDALPDPSDVQIIIYTEYPGQAPQVVEDQVTYPLTSQLLSVPHAKVVRGYSFFGYSFVYLIFDEDTDIYWARSRVLEYLDQAAGGLPQGVTPRLGPDATGVGWIYQYVLQSDRHDLQQLRSIQDWYLRYQLAAVDGVAEVASIGGFIKQYQVSINPNRLLAYNLTIPQIKKAIRNSNSDVGGRLLEMGETEYMIRGRGYLRGIEDLEQIVIGTNNEGTPILLRDFATVSLGPELRRGIAELNGEGETVGGIIVMRYGENAQQTIDRVRARLNALRSGLPEGVSILPVYDRANLIERAVWTLKEKVLEESLVVALITALFLFHLPSALVAIITLPIAILMSFVIMYLQGINSNIMSLGGIAIAIGTMIDAAIIMTENAHKHLEEDAGKKPHGEIIRDSAREVGPTLFFSLLVITVSFIPVFALQEQSGRLFKPLAYTKTYAMAAAALLSVTLVPILMGWFIRGKIKPEEQNPLNRFFIRIYHPLVDFVLKWRWPTLLVAILLMVSISWPLWFAPRPLGSEFMPALQEGDLLYMPTTLPGISTTKARELLQQTDQIIASFPEVERTFGKVGRAETATDPAPLSMLETTIMLKPRDEWRKVPEQRFYSDWPDWLSFIKTPLGWIWPEETRIDINTLITELDREIQFPGLTNAWTMPIRARIDMLSTGIKTPVGIKIMGDDLETLSEIGVQIEALMREQEGTLSAFSERVVGGYYLDFEVNRRAAARHGLTVGEVQEIIQSAIGGVNVTQTVEGLERYTVNLRYQRDFRNDLNSLKRVLVPLKDGTHIPISQLAKLQILQGPPMIKSENARQTAWVYVDLHNIDVGTFVAKAQKVVAEKIHLPEGYSLVWSGQYEYLQAAEKRLQMIIPLTLLLILLIIYLSTRSLIKTTIVLLAVPFSLVGAFWMLYLLGYNMSVATWIGIIALAGLDAETGVVMLLYLDLSYRLRTAEGRMRSLGDLKEAIHHGAVRRVRPKIMTITVIIFGLLPIMWSQGTGADVMKRIAAPMIGGVTTSGLMELLIYPVIYYLWRGRNLPSRAKQPEIVASKK
ncbi:efflux RND transporter permease subunit [Malonomonas rubra]|uniref:efflux RND transporter permease subunit n=1 Tax=Malonomonas rubra TaxID=57040 RepID=UPI0026F06784|nr:CusA/CzcA family heavy metal efflux RND transporter [Malonomonas rubra]